MANVYLGGPISGVEAFNAPAFDTAAADLRARGHVVFSPIEFSRLVFGDKLVTTNANGDETEAADNFGFDRRKAMSVSAAYICLDADMVVLLPGWEKSSGSRAEKALAESLPIPVIKYEELAFWHAASSSAT